MLALRSPRLLAALALAVALGAATAPADQPPAPLGTWRGTSVCTDRVAAPACRDESVVYELTAGRTTGTTRWKADKLVEGRRETMGESELVYRAAEGCWRSEMETPRSHVVWCLTVDGSWMTGTARLLPGGQVVRRVDLRKDAAGAAR